MVEKTIIISSEKLNYNDLYLILILKKSTLPSYQEYLTTIFRENNLNWKLFYPITISGSTRLS